ncbi:MAG: hypothetical protein GAK28_01170 [Luteibacter sp.]|uniref:hypothetical protein n=1 Tax=Luteibacter sp. TaxID=1886636 RepID=UPI0013824880|nr:hypothetical protein [Luteibacter sp.]KAF1008191.1 MAG: hypothetical protein GAK28_01170 [Luteibacter sp.]
MRLHGFVAHSAFVAFAFVSAGSTLAAPRVGPPPGDLISAWIKHRLAVDADRDPLIADARLTNDIVLSPADIYTPVRSVPFSFRGVLWTHTFVDLLSDGYPFSRSTATQALAWDLGMTNGYPGAVDSAHLAPDLGARWAGTQLAKAGVTEAIARKAIGLAGQGAYAVAANYAVAVQILVDKLACYEASEWPSLGLRDDIVQRFMAANALGELRDYDLIYLMRMLQAELSTWHAGEMNMYGRRELPTALRVARVAAAYRDMQGYAHDPCTQGGRHDRSVAATLPTDTTKSMCLVDATDRSVLAWYLTTFDAQTNPEHTNFVVAPAMRMTRLVRPVRPLWLGVFGNELQAHSVNLEVVESLVADQLATDDASEAKAERYTMRRAVFLCAKEIGA